MFVWSTDETNDAKKQKKSKKLLLKTTPVWLNYIHKTHPLTGNSWVMGCLFDEVFDYNIFDSSYFFFRQNEKKKKTRHKILSSFRESSCVDIFSFVFFFFCRESRNGLGKAQGRWRSSSRSLPEYTAVTTTSPPHWLPSSLPFFTRLSSFSLTFASRHGQTCVCREKEGGGNGWTQTRKKNNLSFSPQKENHAESCPSVCLNDFSKKK